MDFRLVAQAFLPNPNGCRIINHKDENRSNNSVNNLEWCSHKYNLNYGNRNSKLSNSLTNNPFFSIPVLQYSKTREFLKEFPSILALLKEKQPMVIFGNSKHYET